MKILGEFPINSIKTLKLLNFRRIEISEEKKNETIAVRLPFVSMPSKLGEVSEVTVISCETKRVSVRF